MAKGSFTERGIFWEVYLQIAKLIIYQVFTGYWFLVYPNSFKVPTSNNTFKPMQPKGVPPQQLKLQKKQISAKDL